MNSSDLRIEYGNKGLPIVGEGGMVCATYVKKRSGEYYYALFNKDGNLYSPTTDTITATSKRMMKTKKISEEAFHLYLRFLNDHNASVYQNANRKVIQ